MNEKMEQLNKIQQELKAPKNQRNDFWNYNYRSAEDILEAIKPLLWKAILTISDEVVLVWNRIYVKATATIKSKDEEMNSTAFAREPESQKWMNEAQITWSASSYARKYALNGLFAIDDTKDADAINKHWKGGKEETTSNYPNNDNLPWIADENIQALEKLSKEWTVMTMKQVREKYKVSKVNQVKLNNIWIK